jgi:hypothetical protein
MFGLIQVLPSVAFALLNQVRAPEKQLKYSLARSATSLPVEPYTVVAFLSADAVIFARNFSDRGSKPQSNYSFCHRLA